LLELAQKNGLESQSCSLESFRSKIILTQPLSDLNSVLQTFQLFQHVLDRPETLERIAFEVIEDVWNEGTKQVELRFSPGFVCQFSQLSWQDALMSFHLGMTQGLQKYPEMKAGLICIASRDQGVETAEQTVEFFLKNRDRFIGLDLAGPELEFPARLFESCFKKAADAGANITIHAGEASGPENIWEAIELLGAKRIGHGIACVQDPLLMEELRKKQICLEMCPTSNWLTRCVPSFEAHPLPQVLRAGIPVCINTDDPGVFAVSLQHEVEICQTYMGLNSKEVEQTFIHAQASSFLN
jgi:adenosine deaminase